MVSKWAMLQKKYKLLLAACAMVVLGSAGTLGVMAAIPHSTTGVISACRSNINGSLRAIDAQAGATCGAGQTALSWPSAQPTVPQRAYARLVVVTDGNGTHTSVDIPNSLNITSWTYIPGADYNNNICLQASFSPKVVLTENHFSGLNVAQILGVNATTASIASYCGSGNYNVVVQGNEGQETGVIYMTE